ncbi:MAG: hypothetical protein M3Q71_16410 [Chloroflexota bacterium]|nr:hypothetical protein [Chloroflexota bacterium]
MQLGTWLPFARAAEFLSRFTHVRVGAATARRLTERTGAACVRHHATDLAQVAEPIR